MQNKYGLRSNATLLGWFPGSSAVNLDIRYPSIGSIQLGIWPVLSVQLIFVWLGCHVPLTQPVYHSSASRKPPPLYRASLQLQAM